MPATNTLSLILPIINCSPRNLIPTANDAWHTVTTQFESQFKQWVGAETLVKQTYKDKKYQRIPSTARHKALFG